MEPVRDTAAGAKRLMRLLGVLVAIAAAAVALAIAVPLAASSSPEYFSRYHLLERRYVNLEGSAHEGIGCRTCHETAAVSNGAQLVGDFYSSLAGTRSLPVYFQFAPPTNAACLQCHRDEWSDDASRTARIPHPAHTRVAEEKRDCVMCHKWTAHFEGVMPKHKEMPFSGVCVAYGCHVGTKKTEQCFDCHHVLVDDEATWLKDHPKVVKDTGQNSCLEGCHKVAQCQECHTTGKKPAFDGRKIEIGMRSIEQLHVKKDWTKTYHGPEALKDEAKCLTCHVTEDECDECHRMRPAFHGSQSTWIGRHKKRTTKVDDPGCITCHQQSFCDTCHQQFKEMG